MCVLKDPVKGFSIISGSFRVCKRVGCFGVVGITTGGAGRRAVAGLKFRERLERGVCGRVWAEPKSEIRRG